MSPIIEMIAFFATLSIFTKDHDRKFLLVNIVRKILVSYNENVEFLFTS